MTASMKGDDALRDFFTALSANIERNVLPGAMKVGAEVIAEDAKAKLGGRRVKTATGSKVLIADTVKVTINAEPGVITAKIQTKGEGAHVTPWPEHGTDPHFISVDDEQSGGRTVARINRLAKDPDSNHSLVIGGKFVGTTVLHDGADPYPFMRPAFDERSASAITAIGNHIGMKLTKAGLEAPAPSDDEE